MNYSRINFINRFKADVGTIAAPLSIDAILADFRSLSPARIVLFYLFAGIAWILFSDAITLRLAIDIYEFRYFAVLKGILFVVATSFILYKLVSSHARQLKRSEENSRLIEQKNSELSYYDLETGLPNQMLLLDRLNQTIALNSRKKKNSALVYISLTGFKTVVDALGHSGGSEAVRIVAGRLSTAVRQYDTVARIHRDEFALLLGGSAREEELLFILNKLHAVFSEPVLLGEEEVLIQACFGVACFPADGMDAEHLLQNSHIAMNQARRNGSLFQFYSEELNRKAVERISIEAGLLRAIEDGELFLCYQPKFAINGKKSIIGMEALVRWQRPGHGVIPPDMFIQTAEENGLIVKLGTFVLREACRQNKIWQDEEMPGLKVAVNISAGQLRDKEFVTRVLNILDETGLDPQYLELELTESAIMENSVDTVYKLLSLKKSGITVSIDDFGTGYSSLSYLKHLPIDTIKIDRAFVRDIVNDPDDAAIVDAIIAMAHSLKLNVVAEGVETAEQLDFLRQRKCCQAQGFYFARPLAKEEFREFINQSVIESNFPDDSHELIFDEAEHTVSDAPENEPESSLCARGAPYTSAEYIGDIALSVHPAAPGDNLTSVLKRFQKDPLLQVLPIVDNGNPVGVINRSTFLEEHVIGMNGFAIYINHSKKMRDLMDPVKLKFEADLTIREAARKIHLQELDIRIDNICVTRKGKYSGVIDVNLFVNAITDINLMLAKGANPLTGLPGNESIQREINDRLSRGETFDIAYIDIDNFKPFNDYYGFERGDAVIKGIAEIITKTVCLSNAGLPCFCGHIGGDDFIVITGPHQAEGVAAEMINALNEYLPVFHGEKDFSAGYYIAVNRKGETERFGLLSLSIGIVNTRLTPVTSYAELASISTEVKRAAKKEHGSSIIVNRRHGSEYRI